MNDLKVLYYEVGYERTNILGSGSDINICGTFKNFEEAFDECRKWNYNYLKRHIKEQGKYRTQVYNFIIKEWEL